MFSCIQMEFHVFQLMPTDCNLSPVTADKRFVSSSSFSSIKYLYTFKRFLSSSLFSCLNYVIQAVSNFTEESRTGSSDMLSYNTSWILERLQPCHCAQTSNSSFVPHVACISLETFQIETQKSSFPRAGCYSGTSFFICLWSKKLHFSMVDCCFPSVLITLGLSLPYPTHNFLSDF